MSHLCPGDTVHFRSKDDFRGPPDTAFAHALLARNRAGIGICVGLGICIGVGLVLVLVHCVSSLNVNFNCRGLRIVVMEQIVAVWSC